MTINLKELATKLTLGTYWVISTPVGSWHIKIQEGPNNFTADSFRILAEAILVKEKEYIYVENTIFMVTGRYSLLPQAECQFIAIKNLAKKDHEA